MNAYKTLLTELDRCDYLVDYQYAGDLSDYLYNGVTYEESTEVYSQKLEKMYVDFLSEWGELSDAARCAAKGMMELIVSKRYLNGDFFFDVPSSEIVDAMINDNAVPRQSVKMARFVHDMAEHQKFYLNRVAEFLGVVLVKEDLLLNPFDVLDSENNLEKVSSEKVDDEPNSAEKSGDSLWDKEWVTYEELIQMFDFRGVKSAKDAAWRKKNGFDKCVSQTGKGTAVKFVVSKVKEWLDNGGGVKKK
jgi:hypothetical protein